MPQVQLWGKKNMQSVTVGHDALQGGELRSRVFGHSPSRGRGFVRQGVCLLCYVFTDSERRKGRQGL